MERRIIQSTYQKLVLEILNIFDIFNIYILINS